jgi:hypothetical protein
MNITVWKTPLKIDHLQTIEVPEGAEFLCAAAQDGTPTLWYTCNPAHKREFRTIMMVGTGHVMMDEGKYIGTVFLNNGTLVFHIFEVPKEEE